VQTPTKLNVRKRARQAAVSLDARGTETSRYALGTDGIRAEPEPTTLGINAFCKRTDLSRMTAWRLDKAGEIECFSIGKKRMVVWDSYLALIKRRQEAEAAKKAASR
jgi:hypothetical protein